MVHYPIRDIKDRIQSFPREKLIHTPTPFKPLEDLSKTLGGPGLFIKREDLTGLAFGGNKSRKLEFIIPDVLEKEVDVIITWASIQSNWCLQTAAAARKFDITPILILFKTYDLPDEYDGNLLLDLILDADIRIKEGIKGKAVQDSEIEAAVNEAVNEVKELGHIPYIAPVGGSMVGWSMEKPLGAISYVNAFVEIVEQAEALGIDFNHVILATGSGGTQAGLVVGAKALRPDTRILGISVLEEKESFSRDVLTIARETVQALDLELDISEEDVIVYDEYIQEGYGIVNKDVAEAVRLFATSEGIFIDPVYTGKALVGLIDLINKGFFRPDEKVVFMHTGGTPALFPNKHLFRKLL